MDSLFETKEKLKNVDTDVADFCSIAQFLGYNLVSIGNVLKDAASDEYVKIEITCGKSGMKSVLTKKAGNCKCPPESQIKDSQFWSVEGVGPSNNSSKNIINTSNSSLLPVIPYEKIELISALLLRAMTVMASCSQQAKQEFVAKTPESRITRHVSLDNFKGRRLDTPFNSALCELEHKFVVPLRSSSPNADVVKCKESTPKEDCKQCRSNYRKLTEIVSLAKEMLDTESLNTTRTIRRMSDIKPPLNLTIDIDSPNPDINLTADKASTPTGIWSNVSNRGNTTMEKKKSRIATLRRLTTPVTPVAASARKMDTPKSGIKRPGTIYNTTAEKKSKPSTSTSILHRNKETLGLRMTKLAARESSLRAPKRLTK